MVLKMTALGVATTSNAYLSSGWNRLDCFIVTSSLLTIVLGPAVRVRAEARVGATATATARAAAHLVRRT